MTDEITNVTRIHPQPSIANPMFENPWAGLTDQEIEDGIFAAQFRIDAAQHTIRSLARERGRRELERSSKCTAWYHDQPGCTCADTQSTEAISTQEGIESDDV